MSPTIGDKLATGLLHQGIYVDGGQVVHNAKGRMVELVSLEEFAAGRGWWVVPYSHPHSTRERRAIVARALSLVRTPYDMINFNCEHAANLAITGKAFSPTLQVLCLLGLAWVGYKVARSAS